MNTKTVALLAVAGGIMYAGYRTKQAAEALMSNLPTPPPNGGPVVNGLSFYQLEGLSGFGKSFKKATRRAVSSVKKISDNKAVVIATGGASALTSKGIKVLEKKSPVFSPLIKKVSKSPSRAPAAAGQETIYQDANGNTITLAQYNAIVSAMQSGQPVPTSGGWALPQGYVSATKPVEPTYQTPGIIPPSINQGTAPVSYTPQPNEELTVTSSYEDPYGSSPSTAYTASDSGSPGLPGGITTELTTPSATEAAPEGVPASNTGKLLVGTGLAAVAAYLAFS